MMINIFLWVVGLLHLFISSRQILFLSHKINLFNKGEHEKILIALRYNIKKITLASIEWLLILLSIGVMLTCGGLNALFHFVMSAVPYNPLNALLFFDLLVLIIQFFRTLFTICKIKLLNSANFRLKQILLDALNETILWLIVISFLSPFILLLYGHNEFWWIFLCSFSIVGLYLYPQINILIIQPLFNQFKPFPHSHLKENLLALLSRTGFTIKEIWLVNQSKRSSMGNAYIVNSGQIKKLVLHDTLYQILSEDQLASVIAHELGHFYYPHHLLELLILSVFSIIYFFSIHLIISSQQFYQALHLTAHATVVELSAIVILFPIFQFLFKPILYSFKRYCEFQADAFAKQQGYGETLANTLHALSVNNLSLPFATRSYTFWHLSHPLLADRLLKLS